MSYEQNYKRLRALIGDDFESFPQYLRFESQGFMSLTFDRLNMKNGVVQYAMTHWYEQNGDLIADPEMVIEIRGEWVEALSIQNAPPFNRIVSVYNEERNKYSPRQKLEQNRFLGLWLRNIKQQGFSRVKISKDDKADSELIFLECACCGRGFKGWQHCDRDEGYGICDDSYCATAYGYHTVGQKPKKA